MINERIAAYCDGLCRSRIAQIELEPKSHPQWVFLSDLDAIRDFAKPWQEILMFFIRMQLTRCTGCPPYQFTARQQKAWQRLCQAAEEPGLEARRSPDAPSFQLSTLHLACLDFSTELLNHVYQTSPYDCALVCTMAMLAHRHNGWLSPRGFPEVLFKVHRIGQSLVLHQTLLQAKDGQLLFDGIATREALETKEGKAELPVGNSGLTARLHGDLLHDWVLHKMVNSTSIPIEWALRPSHNILRLAKHRSIA